MSRDTKTALLNAAEHAARTRGFDGFSFADLAGDVGIRKASVHHHFQSKAALSVALMARYYDRLDVTCTQIDRDHATGRARVSAFMDEYRTALGNGDSLCLCVSFSLSTQSLPADAIRQMDRFRTALLRWLTTAFDAAQTDGTISGVTEPANEAAATLALLEGAQLAARVAGDVARFDSAMMLLMTRLTAQQRA